MTKLFTRTHTQLADMLTPVSIYLKIREQFPISILLESSDYQGKENSFSFIAFEPFDSLVIKGVQTNAQYLLNNFQNKYRLEADSLIARKYNGAFGYLTFESALYFDSFKAIPENDIPEIQFHYFKYVVAFDHFNSTLHLIENSISKETTSKLIEIVELLNQKNGAQFKFQPLEKSTDITDEDYKALVSKAKLHCKQGDVFQLVLSKPYTQKFKGDEFNVYRALRSINPSPYLFYFDYGSFKLMGSSPEAQLIVSDNNAEIHPIAGTTKRSGETLLDEQLGAQLKNDPKENAEHAMLVDLARNDLSRTCTNVQVDKSQHLQFFSHVIHLVSIVKGTLRHKVSAIDALLASFPAGTLSGAPKFKAVELIQAYEKHSRGYYGGAIGYINFNGELNMAIMIRSLMSKNNILHFRAGAGVVIDSIESNELQEVENKLGAINKAIEIAATL